MNRRKFLKFIAKGAAIVGAAGVFGFPVEVKEFSTNDILPKADDTDPDLNDVFNGSFSGWCIMGETVDGATIKEMYEKARNLFFRDRDSDIINKHAFDDYLKNDSNNLVLTHEKRQRFAREIIELEKELPGLMPMWGKLHSVTNNIQRLEHYAHKASKAMQKFNNALGIMN